MTGRTRHTQAAVSSTLAGEERIVWLSHPENFRYVRESVQICAFRKRKPGWRGHCGRLVAYAVLRSSVKAIWPGYGFRRRVWWVKDYDPYPDGGHPYEAVDPLWVRAGQPSRYPAKGALDE